MCAARGSLTFVDWPKIAPHLTQITAPWLHPKFITKSTRFNKWYKSLDEDKKVEFDREFQLGKYFWYSSIYDEMGAGITIEWLLERQLVNENPDCKDIRDIPMEMSQLRRMMVYQWRLGTGDWTILYRFPFWSSITITEFAELFKTTYFCDIILERAYAS